MLILKMRWVHIRAAISAHDIHTHPPNPHTHRTSSLSSGRGGGPQLHVCECGHKFPSVVSLATHAQTCTAKQATTTTSSGSGSNKRQRISGVCVARSAPHPAPHPHVQVQLTLVHIHVRVGHCSRHTHSPPPPPPAPAPTPAPAPPPALPTAGAYIARSASSSCRTSPAGAYVLTAHSHTCSPPNAVPAPAAPPRPALSSLSPALQKKLALLTKHLRGQVSV